MGTVFGKIEVETPKFVVETKTDVFEIRRYPPQMAAQVTYDGDHFQRVGSRSGFFALAGYIGVLGPAENRKPAAGTDAAATAAAAGDERLKIAMTAPVITHTKEATGGEAKNGGAGANQEDGAATAAVAVAHAPKEGEGDVARGEKIAMTAPVITASTTSTRNTSSSSSPSDGSPHTHQTTMQFLLPSSLTPSTAPAPLNPNVSLVELPARRIAALTFSGFTTPELLQQHSERLQRALEQHGSYKVVGDYVLARYNDPFTIPFFRTNEILYPVEEKKGDGA